MHLLQQTMIEGVNKFVELMLKKALKDDQTTLSKQPMLQAYPNTWTRMYPEI